ncbi:MAG: WGR domain-containing protein [Gluconobacter cerinus]|uniref:WGR domain-containing protein n=1 Tax=Gluconobacter cerinus TaxID=38307 RepID=UPI0007CF73F1|nr:WGR domain-containing protein [Gluconobacter cerinus]MBS0984626.1 WGR domain-containing protein [Gluconobacter cerinus]OAG71560.1 WGR domain-containing protein [Gluconobacter japonicus]
MPKAPQTAPPRQFSLFPESARLQRIDPETNCWRFYRLTLQDDLFGGTVLVRSWVRLGTTGQERRERFGDPVAAQKELVRWVRVKQRRGYREDMDG